MKQAATLTYYAIARKDWLLVSEDKYRTIDRARESLAEHMRSISEGDYLGDMVILRTEETTIWDENCMLVRDVRTTLAELIKA